MASDGINRLGRVLQNRMGEVAYSPPTIDLGRIRSDLALIPDGLDLVIPESDYTVMVSHHDCSKCAIREQCTKSRNWKPKKDDRVVVAWIDSEPIIIGKIGG